jgi:hypothetical protein
MNGSVLFDQIQDRNYCNRTTTMAWPERSCENRFRHCDFVSFGELL